MLLGNLLETLRSLRHCAAHDCLRDVAVTAMLETRLERARCYKRPVYLSKICTRSYPFFKILLTKIV